MIMPVMECVQGQDESSLDSAFPNLEPKPRCSRFNLTRPKNNHLQRAAEATEKILMLTLGWNSGFTPPGLAKRVY